MARYLVAFVNTSQTGIQLLPKFYRLIHARKPDEVALPKNTVLFVFLLSDINSVEELQKAFISIAIGRISSLDFSVPCEVENGKSYFVGELKTVNSEEGIYNAETHTFIPSWSLINNNYEIIDL